MGFVAGGAALGASLGPITNFAGAGAGAGGIAALLGNLAGHPLWGPLMAQAGGSLLNQFINPPSAAEKATGKMMQASVDALPMLQRAAAGLPTAATKNIQRQVRQEGQRFGQSYAASARKGGMLGALPGGSTPYRAGLGRIESDVQAATAQQLGTAQQAALSQLTGLGTAAGGLSLGQETLRFQRETQMMEGLADWLEDFHKNEEDPQYKEAYDLVSMIIKQAYEQVKIPNYSTGAR